MEKRLLLPLVYNVVNKAQENASIDENAAMEVRREIEKLILDDATTHKDINILTKRIRVTPRSIDYMRASIRPVVTVLLTLAFMAMLYKGITVKEVTEFDALKDILAIFLGIYGSIIGFWFGEHTATKNQTVANQQSVTSEG